MDPGPPWVEAAAVGYVAAGVPLLGSTLSFLLLRALAVKRMEVEAVEVELTELEEKVAAAEDRLLRELEKDRDEAVRVTDYSVLAHALLSRTGSPLSGSWPRIRW